MRLVAILLPAVLACSHEGRGTVGRLFGRIVIDTRLSLTCSIFHFASAALVATSRNV
ncbi:hypothetical protein BN2475_30052 [Paraburkholderia ribeironis]|uniref:Uncharacterized protein n=1 Tax=Paraburkholderia ribeironis TaxID=1247936 RepID=A0A1N7RJZ5_9BURK|nr:hypothetical protein BN2475_30052 [Paraburkholderia ribeironis]